MKTQIRQGLAITCILLCFLLSACQEKQINQNKTPTDTVRSFLIAVKKRQFSEADTYLVSQENTYLLLSARSIFKESQDYHFSEETLKLLDENLANYIFSIQSEDIQDQEARVSISINSYDMKATFDQVKLKIFNDAKEARTPLDSISLDVQVDPILKNILQDEDRQRINAGLTVYLTKKNHCWLIDDTGYNNPNQAFFNALIGK